MADAAQEPAAAGPETPAGDATEQVTSASEAIQPGEQAVQDAPAADASADAPKDEPKADPESDAPSDDNPEDNSDEPEAAEYEQYDDPRLAACVDILQTANVTVDESNAIFKEAVESGDLSKVDVKALSEKLGDTQATLLMGALSDYFNTTMAAQMSTVKSIKDAFGGDDGWKSVKEWADKARAAGNFTEELDAITSLFDKGGKAAMMGVDKLKELYSADPNTKETPDLTRGDGSGSATGVANPITSVKEYFELLDAAHMKGDKAEIDRINARRAAARPRS